MGSITDNGLLYYDLVKSWGDVYIYLYSERLKKQRAK